MHGESRLRVLARVADAPGLAQKLRVIGARAGCEHVVDAEVLHQDIDRPHIERFGITRATGVAK